MHDDDEKPLDPAAARIVAKVRGLMLIGGGAMLIGIAAIFAVIGYRVFSSEGSAAVVDASAMLPKGARVVSTAVAQDRIAVTIETAAGLEIRIFDIKTLKPAGRLRLTTEP